MEIKKGDLVMVVRGTLCCGRNTGSEGLVFRVSHLDSRFYECRFCGREFSEPTAMDFRGGIRISRLKKIDPPSTGDEVSTRKELHAHT